MTLMSKPILGGEGADNTINLEFNHFRQPLYGGSLASGDFVWWFSSGTSLNPQAAPMRVQRSGNYVCYARVSVNWGTLPQWNNLKLSVGIGGSYINKINNQSINVYHSIIDGKYYYVTNSFSLLDTDLVGLQVVDNINQGPFLASTSLHEIGLRKVV